MSGSLQNQQVLSLRLGGPIAIAQRPIINPHNLKIIGWWCQAPAAGEPLVLLTDNIREVTPAGLAVNDEDALSAPDDLVRQKEILELEFQLIDKLVKTKRQKLGKVSDYSYNDGLFVQKLYVARSLVKVFTNEDTLIIDRAQILEVTDSYILVRDSDVKATEEEMAPAAEAAAAWVKNT